MSTPAPDVGTIAWTDLTVPDAENVRTFYENVVGWTAQAVDMDGYNDYCMIPASGDGSTPVAGICHARGPNASLPPQWLIYIMVPDLDRSVEACTRLGGKTLTSVKSCGGSRMVVIQDPAGAVAALMQSDPAATG